jgi:hypothetical protein
MGAGRALGIAHRSTRKKRLEDSGTIESLQGWKHGQGIFEQRERLETFPRIGRFDRFRPRRSTSWQGVG